MKRFSASGLTDRYIYVMLVVFPLFVGPRGYAAITLSKFLFFGVITLIWTIWCAAALIKSHGTELNRPDTRIPALVAAYFLICCTSAVFSAYGASVIIGNGRFDGLLTTLLCVLSFFGAAFLAKAKLSYLYAALFAGASCCIVGVIQLFGLNPLGLFPNSYDYYDAGAEFTGSFFGTIGNADLLSAYLCLLLPIVSAYYITAEKAEKRLLLCIALLSFSLLACGVSAGLLSCACMALLMPPLLITSGERLRRGLECAAAVLISLGLAACFNGEKAEGRICISFTVSAMAAVMFILAAFAVISRHLLRKSEFGKKGLRIFFSIFSIAAAVGALVGIYLLAPGSGSLWEISQVLRGNIQESFGSSRIRIWREVLSIVPERPLLGGGPGTLALRISVEFSRYVPETGKTLTAFIDNAHNEYLGMLASTGLFSLLCHLAAQILSVVLALKRGSKTALCLICGLVCYWIQGFFGLGLFLVSPLMWICWGLLTSDLCKPILKDTE